MIKLRVRVRVSFILFYSELAHTDPSCNMIQSLRGWKKCEEEMSDEQPYNFKKLHQFSMLRYFKILQ